MSARFLWVVYFCLSTVRSKVPFSMCTQPQTEACPMKDCVFMPRPTLPTPASLAEYKPYKYVTLCYLSSRPETTISRNPQLEKLAKHSCSKNNQETQHRFKPCIPKLLAVLSVSRQLGLDTFHKGIIHHQNHARIDGSLPLLSLEARMCQKTASDKAGSPCASEAVHQCISAPDARVAAEPLVPLMTQQTRCPWRIDSDASEPRTSICQGNACRLV